MVVTTYLLGFEAISVFARIHIRTDTYLDPPRRAPAMEAIPARPAILEAMTDFRDLEQS